MPKFIQFQHLVGAKRSPVPINVIILSGSSGAGIDPPTLPIFSTKCFIQTSLQMEMIQVRINSCMHSDHLGDAFSYLPRILQIKMLIQNLS